MIQRRNIIVFFIVLPFMLVLQSGARQEIKASAVKAAWIDHFSKFVEWPNINDTTDTFIIKVIGTDELEGYLNRIYDKRTIKNRPVTIEFIKDISEIEFCHILYISESERKSLAKIISLIENRPILTVGSTEGYGYDGVIINFYNEQNKVRFEFNISASKKNDLEVSFRLLEMARIIKRN